VSGIRTRAATEWRPVVGWSGYEVSDSGQVRSWRIGGNTKRERRDEPLLRAVRVNPRTGYPTVDLSVHYRTRTVTVHRLVAESFLGPIPVGMTVNHKDGRKTNNCVENLEIISHRDNALHALALGLYATGERAANAKLSNAAVRTIRSEYAAGGVSQSVLGRKYGVSKSLIGYIVTNRRRRHAKEAA
jgi:hypothetical protein